MTDSTSPADTNPLPTPVQLLLCAAEPSGLIAEYRYTILSALQGDTGILQESLDQILKSPGAGGAQQALREKLVRSFQGGGYLAGADDLGVLTREFYTRPSREPDEELSIALHTVMIVLVTRDLVDDRPFMEWIDRCSGKIRERQPHSCLLILDLESAMPDFFDAAPGASWSQAKPAETLGEFAVRPTVASLVALHRCLQVLTEGSENSAQKMRLFVSHAKLDGLPLAKALTEMIETLPGFEGFYDAADIPWGTDWSEVLKKGVRDSIVIVLRSDMYETRAWCTREMLWADEFASPMVVVDLRSDAIALPSKLSFDRAPSLRIPDGNLYRVVFMALREGVRARMHLRTVQHMIDTGRLQSDATYSAVRQPTMNALRMICENNRDKGDLTILYPDPPMHRGDLDAAQALVASYSPGFRVTTPEGLVAMNEGTGG